MVSIAPLLKRVPIRSLSNAEQCALQKHLRRSYTLPLVPEPVDPFWTASLFDVKVGESVMKELKSEEDDGEEVDKSRGTSPQDQCNNEPDEVASDSGKGTAVSSPVSCATKSGEVRRLKRKSKSLVSESEQSQATSEDSGVVPNRKTAKKHLLMEGSGGAIKGKGGDGDGVEEKKGVVAKKKEKKSSNKVGKEESSGSKIKVNNANKNSGNNNKKKVAKSNSNEGVKHLTGARQKLQQYSKMSKRSDGNINHCLKSNRLSAERKGSAKKERC